MENEFFEGKDFGKQDFKALMPKYYPTEYQEYIKQERALLLDHLKGSKSVLEAGVGTGRLIPDIAPIVGNLAGVDIANLMLEQARRTASNYSNVEILTLNINELPNRFSANTFTHTVCMWNTLGNVDEVEVLKKVSAVTSNNIFVTVFLKGTAEKRKKFYKTVGVEMKEVDEDTETFFRPVVCAQRHMMKRT